MTLITYFLFRLGYWEALTGFLTSESVNQSGTLGPALLHRLPNFLCCLISKVVTSVPLIRSRLVTCFSQSAVVLMLLVGSFFTFLSERKGTNRKCAAPGDVHKLRTPVSPAQIRTEGSRQSPWCPLPVIPLPAMENHYLTSHLRDLNQKFLKN